MRSWENRTDTAVLDEPLYAHFLATTGLDHPGADDIVAAGPRRWQEAVDRCVDPPMGQAETISYQKQMAHHLLPGCDLGWIAGSANVLLLRHPRRVIASYVRVRQLPTLEDLGFPQLMMLQRRFGPLPVIEADSFLQNPEDALRSLCGTLDVPFDTAMLAWPVGPRATDGVWARDWYRAVEASTGFSKAPTDDPATIELPSPLEPVARDAQRLFDVLQRSGTG